jgi:hypothetical protein
VIVVRQASVSDLSGLGVDPVLAARQIEHGPALAVTRAGSGDVLAAGGCFLHGEQKRLGELWFGAAPGCPPMAVRPLLRFLDLWKQQHPDLVLVMFRGPEAVAFERLAVACGLNVKGDCAWATP